MISKSRLEFETMSCQNRNHFLCSRCHRCSHQYYWLISNKCFPSFSPPFSFFCLSCIFVYYYFNIAIFVNYQFYLWLFKLFLSIYVRCQVSWFVTDAVTSGKGNHFTVTWIWFCDDFVDLPTLSLLLHIVSFFLSFSFPLPPLSIFPLFKIFFFWKLKEFYT